MAKYEPEDISQLVYVIMAQRRGTTEKVRARYATLEEAEKKLYELNLRKNPHLKYRIVGPENENQQEIKLKLRLINALDLLIEQFQDLNPKKSSIVDVLTETRAELLRLQNAEEEAKYFRELCEAYEKRIRWKFDQ